MGRWSKGWSKADPNVRTEIDGGRLSNSWLNLSPRLSSVREDGRWSNGWLNARPRVSLVREGGRWSNDWLKVSPRSSSVSECGSKVTDWSNLFMTSSLRRELGRWLIGLLKSLTERCVREHGRLSADESEGRESWVREGRLQMTNVSFECFKLLRPTGSVSGCG